jgi:hypothetical protein
MTARVQRDFEFVSGVYIDNELHMNVYDVEINFLVESENIYEQNIALDRIKYFFIEKLENAVFLNQTDAAISDKFSDMGIKTILLPEDPYDQIIGIMLMSKVDAITEGRLAVSDICISSRMSDGVSYLHSMEEHMGPFTVKGWWSDSSPNTSLPRKNKKVVKIKEASTTWDDFMLGWRPVKIDLSNDVIMVDFETKLDK